MHDILLLCLQRSSARIAIQEFEALKATTPFEGAFTRKLTDIVMTDGTFARQNVIIRPFVGVSVIWTEISDIRSEAVKYRRQANHDPLTGLLNRRGFEKSLAGHRKSKRNLDGASLLLIDLDNFKQVNDKFGHDSGDRVLIHTAECLKQVFGLGAFIARIGGDEFAVLQFGRGANTSMTSAREKLNKLVRLNEFAPGAETGLGVSVGAVMLNNDENLTIDEWFRRADREMYACKKARKEELLNGPVTPCVYHFQPIVTFGSHEIVGFEALMRPAEDVMGQLAECDLISALMEQGALARVERNCLSQVIAEFHRLRDLTGTAYQFSINICQEQWDDPGFADWLVGALDEGDMPCRYLRVELLEDVRLDGPTEQAISANLSALAQAGICVDIDDFGTSGASLDRLVLPAVSRVKISREMVKDYWEDLRMRRIVDSIISLTFEMDLTIVVEGIEEDWQHDAFQAHGCGFFQGFLFAPPMSSAELDVWIRAKGLGPLAAELPDNPVECLQLEVGRQMRA